ncbi:hypothetical protein [Pasteuria penetrans]|uniref:hypothetical protein n=1 Tax=Pasteuria penetrans TaxID=86005 RepID=UPI000F913BC0|nr:hypothetical protein [Pasteuria penetrans]
MGDHEATSIEKWIGCLLGGCPLAAVESKIIDHWFGSYGKRNRKLGHQFFFCYNEGD